MHWPGHMQSRNHRTCTSMHVETNVRSKWGSHRSNLSLQLSSKNPTKLTKMTNSTLQPCRTAFHYRLPISRNNLRISDYPSISGDNDTTIQAKRRCGKAIPTASEFRQRPGKQTDVFQEKNDGGKWSWYFGTTWKTHGLTLGKADCWLWMKVKAVKLDWHLI